MSNWKFDASEDLDQFMKDRGLYGTDMHFIAKECRNNATDHGFDLSNKEQQIVAFVDEVGEWCSAVRKGDTENELEEIVDMVIRLMAYAEQHFPMWKFAMVSKMKYNRDRPYKHGKQF